LYQFDAAIPCAPQAIAACSGAALLLSIFIECEFCPAQNAVLGSSFAPQVTLFLLA
jgi:hypothetical protein